MANQRKRLLIEEIETINDESEDDNTEGPYKELSKLSNFFEVRDY